MSVTLSPEASSLLRAAIRETGADEGTLWLLDDEQRHLVPVWNSGERAAEFVGSFRQPLSSGLVSIACITGQALCENGIAHNAQHDNTLDRTLGVQTCAMVAVPVVSPRGILGVVSCVKLKHPAELPDPAPFGMEELVILQKAAATLVAVLGEE